MLLIKHSRGANLDYAPTYPVFSQALSEPSAGATLTTVLNELIGFASNELATKVKVKLPSSVLSQSFRMKQEL